MTGRGETGELDIWEWLLVLLSLIVFFAVPFYPDLQVTGLILMPVLLVRTWQMMKALEQMEEDFRISDGDRGLR